MKTRELIELLQRENPNSEVICQADAAGNRFYPLEGLWTGYFEPVSESASQVQCLTSSPAVFLVPEH